MSEISTVKFKDLITGFIFGSIEFDQMRNELVNYRNHELRCKELSDALCCPESAVKTRILNALTDLKIVYSALNN